MATAPNGDAQRSWDTCLSTLLGPSPVVVTESWERGWAHLRDLGVADILVEKFLQNARDHVDGMCSNFFRTLADSCRETEDTEAPSSAVSSFYQAVLQLDEHCRGLFEAATVLDQRDATDGKKGSVRDSLSAILKVKTVVPRIHDFTESSSRYFESVFRGHVVEISTREPVAEDGDEDDDDEEEEEEEEEEEGGNAVEKQEQDRQSLQTFSHLCEILRRVGWSTMLEDMYTRLLYAQLSKTVRRKCAGCFDRPLLLRMEKWAVGVALPWIAYLFPGKEDEDLLRSRLRGRLRRVFCEMRKDEIFSIISEYPDSQPALSDLRKCLQKDSQWYGEQFRELSESLRQSFQSRLLIPGANTSQILVMYVSAIKALHILDPSGIFFEAVSGPVKEYLRKRKHTVRCIVASLTDEDASGELHEELGLAEARLIEHDDVSDDEDADDGDGEGGQSSSDIQRALQWDPDPIEAQPRASSSRRTKDVLSILVQIYGSKELFVTEFRKMLAERLLKKEAFDFDTDHEVRTLELLKLRFGSMQNCEIMVKDIADSKRVNSNIGEVSLAEDANLDAVIMSSQFWPALQTPSATKGDSSGLHGSGDDDMVEVKVHQSLKEAFEAYDSKYKDIKAPRQLQWKYHLGTVNLEIELEGTVREFNVTPIEASILSYFEGASKSSQVPVTVKFLCEESNLDSAAVLRILGMWSNCGVIEEVRTSGSGDDRAWTVVENLSDDAIAAKTVSAEADDESDQAEQDAAAREMKVYESYILGMLRNFDSLPLDRIHNMLKMFVSTGEQKYEKELPQLKSFLAHLVAEEKLTTDGAMYSLCK
eukprot:g3252.t1